MAIPTDPTTTTSTFVVAEDNPAADLLKFGKIETKSNSIIANKIGVRKSTYPTKLLFREGKIIDIIDPCKTGIERNPGPWLADNQLRDLDNEFWLVVY